MLQSLPLLLEDRSLSGNRKASMHRRDAAVKKKIRYQIYDQSVEKEINYIPVRYMLAIAITLLEVAAIIGILVVLCWYCRISISPRG